jgi:antitoxin component HigA of HigAB toxin-antitoxin module
MARRDEFVCRQVWEPFSKTQPALNALSACIEILGPLSENDRARVLSWLTDAAEDSSAPWDAPEPR